MPQVKCPKCGRVRLVVEGKKKNCRKCGTPLTATPAMAVKPEEQKITAPPAITAADLQKQFPEQIAEIIKAAQPQSTILGEKGEVVDAELSQAKVIVDVLKKQYSKVFNKITAQIEKTRKQNESTGIKDAPNTGSTT